MFEIGIAPAPGNASWLRHIVIGGAAGIVRRGRRVRVELSPRLTASEGHEANTFPTDLALLVAGVL